MRRLILALMAATLLAACAVKPETPFSDAEVAQATYRAGGQPTVTLLTSRNIRNGSGAHSALMINASQQVIFDPAGSFRSPKIVRRGDVIYNTHPVLVDSYKRFQARGIFRLQVQTLAVSPELAEALLRAVQQIGPVADARCAVSISGLLGQHPQTQVRQTWFPNALSDDFAKLAGVTSQDLYEYVGADGVGVLGPYDPDRVKITN